MSLLDALDPNEYPQITAASLVPREKVTSCKLGKTRLRAILSAKTVERSKNRTSQR